MAHHLADQYRSGLKSFGKWMPEALSAYNQFTSTCFGPGALSVKEKHLQALAISLYAANEHCIALHLDAVLHEGASEQEIAETVAVAGAFGGGTTLSHGVILVDELMKEKKQGVQ